MGFHRVFSSLLLVVAMGASHNPIWANEPLGGDFSLTDQDGRLFELQQLRGKVVLIFFGYTFCPDICPTELATVAAVLNELEDDSEQVQGVFVSVDPERDNPQILKSYIGYFNKHLIGLTGSPDEIERVANRYRVKFRKQPRTDGAYSMDHSANLYVIDRTGQLFAVIPYGLPPEHVLGVVRRLLTGDT